MNLVKDNGDKASISSQMALLIKWILSKDNTSEFKVMLDFLIDFQQYSQIIDDADILLDGSWGTGLTISGLELLLPTSRSLHSY